jgi:predicted DNA-binding protein (UPF0251 family)
MARPNKPRRICELPEYQMFGPKGRRANTLEKIVLMIDEYEVFRLIDSENFTQEEAASQMEVARTTVQRIYNNARKKIADAIVNGKILMIEGGEYVVCDDDCDECFVHMGQHRRHRKG